MLDFLEIQRSNFRFMTTLDVLIAIPVIPLAPMVITWWLPWERWIPWGKLPKLVLGPYVVYAGFAAWHFHSSNWFVLIMIVAGAILTIMGAVEEAPATLPSTTDKQFLKSLEDWLGGQSEVMILVRYSRAAGSKSFEFFTSFAALRARLALLKAETSVTAFRKPQLPLRGRVDDEFIGKCLSFIPGGTEFLVLETDPRMATQQWLFHHQAGASTDELQQALEGLRGRLVAVGEYPQWLKDSPDVISAYVPKQDGTVKAGVY
ncbi:MAG TPA: hypothetical protein VE377_23355 [Candidatus Dormibacteraeota bacterium]|nr:hypothetical protein [Candidatus Dormibacteraeota bacterium]